jgi:hypothetical protein
VLRERLRGLPVVCWSTARRAEGVVCAQTLATLAAERHLVPPCVPHEMRFKPDGAARRAGMRPQSESYAKPTDGAAARDSAFPSSSCLAVQALAGGSIGEPPTGSHPEIPSQYAIRPTQAGNPAAANLVELRSPVTRLTVTMVERASWLGLWHQATHLPAIVGQ